MHSTVRDILLWQQNFADMKVGTPALLAEMQTPAVLTSGNRSPYGFGLAIGEYHGLRTIEHGGGDRGIATNARRYPDQGLAIAVLCNLDTIPAAMLTQRIADIYLADVLPTPTEENAVAAMRKALLSADELTAKAGLYREPSSDGAVRMSVRNGTLVVHSYYGDDSDVELTPVNANKFLYPGTTTAIEFVPAAAGRVQEWHVTNEGRHLETVQLSLFVPSTLDLQSSAGEYRSPEIDVTYTVARRDSGLVVQPPGRADISLLPVSKDVFAGNTVGTVKFLRDARGAISAFTVNRYNAQGVRFDRVKPAGSPANGADVRNSRQ